MWKQGIAGLLLAATTSFTGGVAFAQAPAPYVVTPELEQAAKSEGKVVFYTATDVAVAEALAALFRQKYPEIQVQVERAGSERVFQRIGQEYSTGIYNADVIETSDAVHFEYFKREGWLEPTLPQEVADKWPADEKDPDGNFAAYRAHLSVLAYRTDLLPEADVPTTWTDLLDPKYKGKMVKAHPGYSGTIMTATYVLSEKLGWDYFEKLGAQQVMQVQSSTEPPKKLAQGERALEVDGNEYNIFRLQEDGVPIKIVYPAEGTPLAVGNAAVLKEAPNKNAAKLFYAFLFSKEAQQLNSDSGGLRSFHPDVVEKSTRTPLKDIAILHSDPVALEEKLDEIKSNYERYFGT
ncbi:ABC transporter substrate-binding protein [Tianweitania sp.]|uniref:ABC transporter substrate-binding protein n=1 Tax=Tianweitania sp. TaxID=2021634 RepID=UPI00289C9A98|nr:extracellular solute-binding protein [Tianweitania sp.]